MNRQASKSYYDFRLRRQMRSYYEARTNKHISNVIRLFKRLVDNLPIFIQNSDKLTHKPYYDIENHDYTKFSDELYEPYVYLTWKKKCEKEGIDYSYPSGMSSEIIIATEKHITMEPHHPEYYDSEFGGINSFNRDEVIFTVDATTMPNRYIMEMVADCKAVGDEMGNSVRSWFDKQIGNRWKFNKKQIYLIYKCIDILEP